MHDDGSENAPVRTVLLYFQQGYANDNGLFYIARGAFCLVFVLSSTG
jgi:hypothetical protein